MTLSSKYVKITGIDQRFDLDQPVEMLNLKGRQFAQEEFLKNRSFQ